MSDIVCNQIVFKITSSLAFSKIICKGFGSYHPVYILYNQNRVAIQLLLIVLFMLLLLELVKALSVNRALDPAGQNKTTILI